MIQYDDISPEDLSRYWGKGTVFMPLRNGDEVVWNAYTTYEVGTSRVMLKLVKGLPITKLSSGEAPETALTLTYQEFFRQVLLHRPALGVLTREDGSVYLLSWQHADGNDLCKAIRNEDVRVDMLVPPTGAAPDTDEEWPDVWGRLLSQHWDRVKAADHAARLDQLIGNGLMRASTEYGQHPTTQWPRPGRQRMVADKNATRYVLEYLNQAPHTIRRAASMPPDKPVALSGPAWLRPAKKGWDLMAGTQRVGLILPETCELVRVKGHNVRNLIGKRLFAALY